MDTSIFGQKITVSDSGMYSATDLIKAGNNWLLKMVNLCFHGMSGDKAIIQESLLWS